MDMIEIRLNPTRVESVNFSCDDEGDEDFHLAIYSLIRPQIEAIDSVLRRLTRVATAQRPGCSEADP